MPKDYAHRSRAKKKKRKGASKRKGTSKKKPSASSRRPETSSRRSVWVASIAIIVLIAGLIVSLLFIQHRYHVSTVTSSSGAMAETAAPVISASKQAKEKAKQKAKETKEPPPVKFDFYNTLPNMEVDVSDGKPASNVSSVFDNQKSSQYVLQLASLSSKESASAFQAKVDKEGFRTKILPVVRGQMTWYRVQAGPFSNQEAAQKEQSALQAKKIPSILAAG